MPMKHLKQETRRIAKLPPEERLSYLKSDRWIGYTRAQSALSEMSALIEDQPGRVRPQNMLIVGPSNNGKSTIAEKFLRQNPSRVSEGGDHQVIPVLSIQMPPDVTSGRFYALLLDSLGSPVGQGSRLERRSSIAVDFMRTCEVRLLLIDELHNLLCVPSPRQREILGLIRYLGNDLRIPIVALGTREAYMALRLDDQLENRFQPFLLPRWENDEETGRVLASFETLLPLRECSGLGNPELSDLIIERSDGLIGEMHQLLAQATAYVLSNGNERITAEDIVSCGVEAPSIRRRKMERALRA